MNYAQVREFDIANGEGIRTTIFVSGCSIHCPCCFNKDYQDFNYGNVFTDDTKRYIISCINSSNISGLSVLGGEPLDQDETLEGLLKDIKANTKKDIWLWTGYTYENLNSTQLHLVNSYIDVLVDGRFIEELKDLRLKFRGSSNQRVIDVPATVQQGKIIDKYNSP